VHSFPLKNELKDATKAFFVTHESLKSPMGGNTAAFENKAEAQTMADKLGVEVKTWQ
jgi:copper chaperone NosL